MPSHALPIARIKLARSLPRLLALPALIVVAGAALVGVALWVGGMPLMVTAGVGGLVALVVGVAQAARLMSVRVDVEESAVRLRSIGSDRAFALVPGPVTRVRLRGEQASSLRSSTRWLGYDLGTARLRDEEDIKVIRLAATNSVILIPTEHGRLALAAAEELSLLDALTRAARARQRLESIAVQPPRMPGSASDGADLTSPGGPEALAPEATAPPMTGIERARFERRQVEERDASARVASESSAEADAPSALSATVADLPDAVPAAPEVESADGAAPNAKPEPEMPAPSSVSADRRRRLRVLRPSWVRRPQPSIILVVLPLAAAGAAWTVGIARDAIPASSTDMGRLTSLALVLAGPGSTVGAIVARIWWPRLVAVVVAGGIVSAVFVGRALLG